jgi:hypothetical protein
LGAPSPGHGAQLVPHEETLVLSSQVAAAPVPHAW